MMSERNNLILQQLDSFCPDPKPSLIYTTPYQLLIAVLLSARCKDERVNQVTPSLFQEAPTPQSMRMLPIEKIETLIHSCGFFKVKARYIQKLSEQLCTHYNGQVPSTFEALEGLAGIGHKTASVVMGHAFGAKTFPVDTHIHRLSLKWQLSKGPSVEKIEADLKRSFPDTIWHKLHLQMIEYGRNYCNRFACTSRKPCPICQALLNFDTASGKQLL